MSRNPLIRAAALVCALLTFARASRASEPFQAFLDGLRQRQMFDIARDYLEQSKTNPLVSESDRQRIPFEEGRQLLEEASTVRDLAERKRRLDEGQQKLQVFLKANPTHPVAAEATVQLGAVLLDRGQVALTAARSAKQGGNRDKLIAEARQRFEQAQKVFTEAESKFEADLNKLPKVIDPKDEPQIVARDQGRLHLMQAQLYGARLLFDQSKLADPGSDDSKAKLKAAADKYGEIYKKYMKYKGGLAARVRQGRCLLDLGETTDALTYEEEVLAICSEAIHREPARKAELQSLIREALAIELECWLASNGKKNDKDYDKAIELGRKWMAEATAAEEQTVDGLSIVWLTAQAYKREAETVKDDKKKKDTDTREAARLAAQVARSPGEHQNEARELAAQLRSATAENEPTTFADALAEGKAAIDELAENLQLIKQAQAPGGDRSRLQEWEQAKAAAIEKAQRGFRRAMSLRNKDIAIDQVNEVRYLQAYLNYVAGRYYDAAVIGDFVARKYPDSGFARQSAQIALAADLQAYNGQAADARDFELARMTSIAEYTANRWPDQPEAAEAWMLLADVALRGGNISAANEYLAKIPANSPARADADLKQGQALWARYVEGLASTDTNQPAKADSEQLLAQAQQTLERGLEHVHQRGDSPSYNVLAAELSLAQLYNTMGQSDRALKILERPETGPLALVAANNALAERANYSAEALKCALRAYVGAQQLDRAEAMMRQLDKKYANEPNGTAALTGLYVGLGRELEGQLKQLQSSGKADELKRVLEGFQRFLEHIAKRESNSPSTWNWIGETYFRLGAGLDGQRTRADQAVAFFGKSVGAYTRLLEVAKKDPKLQGTTNAIRLKLARSLRAEGQFQKAIDQISEILRANPKVLECQMEAATTYQMWGERSPEYYQQAINGSDGQGGGLIWGWNGLRRRLQQAPKYKQFYEQARFNVADCSYRLALSKKGDEKKDALGFAERLITSFARLDPKLGGPEWRAKYDSLMKDIQRAGGRQPEGLSTLPSAATASHRKSPAG